jgi:HlyD family secretion protein
MANTRRFLKRGILAFGLLALIAVLAFHIASDRGRRGLVQGFAKGNGRMEATEVDIATKVPGRLSEVLVEEGDMVEKDQVVARMDTSTLDAQLRQAQAEVARLKQARLTALSRVESIRLRMVLAGKELERSRQLHAQGIVAQQQYDRDLTARQTLEADHVAAQSAWPRWTPPSRRPRPRRNGCRPRSATAC